MTAAGPRVLVELAFSPGWQQVERARRAVVEGLASTRAEEHVETAVMVASELVENAIKYGDWRAESLARSARTDDSSDAPRSSREGEASGVLSVVLIESTGAGELRIEVASPIGEGEATERLERALSRITEAASPRDAYLERMQIAARSSIPGGMGLVRVAYEAHAVLRHRVERGLVVVTAALDLARPSVALRGARPSKESER